MLGLKLQLLYPCLFKKGQRGGRHVITKRLKGRRWRRRCEVVINLITGTVTSEHGIPPWRTSEVSARLYEGPSTGLLERKPLTPSRPSKVCSSSSSQPPGAKRVPGKLQVAPLSPQYRRRTYTDSVVSRRIIGIGITELERFRVQRA